MRRPRFIAEQARHATGLLGRVIATIMAGETWAQNQRAIEALGAASCDHVLDIGCGPGRSLSELSRQAPEGRIVGVDPSPVMAEAAARRNPRAEIFVADATSLPFEDGAFDKALCVHVVYFWAELGAPLREIARVLRPGGQFALLFRTNADEAAVAAFPPEVYTFRAFHDVASALEAAGFEIEREENLQDSALPALIIARKR